jgi:manganese/iron transport system substrate-binding protein
MKKNILNINYLRSLSFGLLMGCIGCGNLASSTSFTQTTTVVNDNLPRVVATTSILCDLTKQIASNTINLTCLVPPGTSPHTYQPKPEDRQALEQANLILYNGYNLEPGLINLIRTIKTPAPKIAVAQAAVPKPQNFRKNANTVANPHIWHNVNHAMKMVNVISSNLEKLEPSNAESYASNKIQINQQLSQLDRWIKTRISSIPSDKRRLVTTHNALSYYTQAYGLSLAGTLESVHANQQLTTTQVKNLARNIQQAKVPTIFPEMTTNPNLLQPVANTAKVKVSQRKLYTDGLGEPGSKGENYQKMMAANTRTIVEGLGGTYLIFQPQQPTAAN